MIKNDEVIGVTIEWLDAAGNPEHLDMDVAPQQDHDSPAEATEHPVESGFDAADHVHIKARKLSLQIINSDLPPKHPDHGRALAIYEKLLGIQRTATLVTVYTSQGLYRNMALESVKSNRTSSTGRAVQVALELKQIRVVSTQRVVLTNTPKGRAKDRGGHKTAQPANPPEIATSVWSHAFHAAFGGKPTGAVP